MLPRRLVQGFSWMDQVCWAGTHELFSYGITRGEHVATLMGINNGLLLESGGFMATSIICPDY